MNLRVIGFTELAPNSRIIKQMKSQDTIISLIGINNYDHLVIMWRFVGGWRFALICGILISLYPIGYLSLPFWEQGTNQSTVELWRKSVVGIYVLGGMSLIMICVAIAFLMGTGIALWTSFEYMRDRYYDIATAYRKQNEKGKI